MAGATETDGPMLKEVTQREKYDGKPSDERKILDFTHTDSHKKTARLRGGNCGR